MSGRERRNFAPSAGDPPLRASGAGSAATTNGNLAYTAGANNTAGALHGHTNGPAATVSTSVTITPKVSGVFSVMAFLGAIDATDSDPCTWALSDGTNTLASGAIVSDATAGNVLVSANLLAGANPYTVGTPVTFTLSITSTGGHNLTATNIKGNVDAFELP